MQHFSCLEGEEFVTPADGRRDLFGCWVSSCCRITFLDVTLLKALLTSCGEKHFEMGA